MKNLVGIFCTALACGSFATDGTWIAGSGTLNYTDTANWKDGIVAAEGGTMTVTNTAATTVNLTDSVTLGKICGYVNNFFYFNSGTWVLTEPAQIVNNSVYTEADTFQFQGTSTIQTAGDLTVGGVARVVFMNANDIGGRFVVKGPGGRARAKTEVCMGPTPESYVADAVVLDGGTLENAEGNTWLTFSENRGIYVTENNGYLGACCNGSAGVRVLSKITGPGSFGVNGQVLSVYIANPANDYRGDTVVGSIGPGVTQSDAKFRTEADEVIPHGEGYGVLQLGPHSTYLRTGNYTSPNGTLLPKVSYSRLYLQGHTETVNAVEGSAYGYLHGGTLILGSDADSHFNGFLESDATLVKRGTGTLWMTGAHSYGKIELEAGTLALAPNYLHANAVLETKGGSLVLAGPTGCWEENGGVQYGYVSSVRYSVSGEKIHNSKWYVPETRNYSFARSFKGTCSLEIDGNVILSGTAADNAITVVRDVQLTQGWHTVRIVVDNGNAYSSKLPAGIMFDPENGAFATDEEIFRARQFTDDNGPDMRADGGVFRTEGKVVVSAPTTISKDEFLGEAILGGLLTTDPENPQTLTVDLPEGESLYIGSINAAAPARVEAPIVGQFAYCDYCWLTAPLAANASFAEHAMPVLGYAGALANPITLTDHSLRVTDPTTGSATITVGEGEILRFDTLDLVDGAYNDAAGKEVRTFTNNVVLDGGTLLLTGPSDLILAGNVSGTGTILKEGNGTAAITGTVTVDADSQISVTAGMLRLPSAGAAAISVTGGRLANLENAALDLSANVAEVRGGNFQIDGGSITVGDGFTGLCSSYGTGTLRIGGTTAGTAEVAARESTTLELAKEGVASLATVVAVDYGSTLKIATEATNWCSGNFTLSGGTLDLNGHDFSFSTLTSNSSFSTIVNNGTDPSTVTIDNAAALTLKCNFANGTGALSVVKRGAGTLTLPGKVICTAFDIEAGTVVSRPPTGVKGTALRWIPWTSRPSGTQPNTGTQVEQLVLKRSGTNLAWPTGTTAATVNTYNLGGSGQQNASKIINGTLYANTYDKLYDTAYADPVIITLGAEMAFETYDFATANDCDGRDPYTWTLEVGRTENGATVWYPCSGVNEFACTTTRSTWMNGNFAVADLSPRFTGTAITVAEGATLELHDVKEELASLTVEGTLVRDSESPVATMPSIDPGTTLRTLAGGRAKYFRFNILKSETGTTTMQISEFQLWLNGVRVPWPTGTTATWSGGVYKSGEEPAKILDGATNTKCFTAGNLGAFTITAAVPVEFNSYCWYTANDDYNRDPVSWTFEVSHDGVNWTLLDAVDSRGCTGTRQALAYASDPVAAPSDGRVVAKYLKFEITNVRNGVNQMQFSEFEVLTNGVRVAWPANTRLGWSLYRNNNNNEAPAKLIDGSYDTKFYTTGSGAGAVMIYCPGGITFDAYRWATANDSATTRDPIGWKFSVSLDGSHWQELDNVPNYNTTGTRKVVAYTSPNLTSQFEVLPDASVAALDGSTLSVGGPETIGGVDGTGTLEVFGAAMLDVAANTTQTFDGLVAGKGALVKTGEGVQVLQGDVTLNGQLVVKEGELRLDQVTLPDGLVIVLEGGKITGTATCAGNLTVQSNGGAYGASIALTGALSLTGEMKLAPDAKYATNRICFEYGSTDAESQAVFLSSDCSEVLPGKFNFKTAIVGNQMKLNIYPSCTIIYVR